MSCYFSFVICFAMLNVISIMFYNPILSLIGLVYPLFPAVYKRKASLRLVRKTVGEFLPGDCTRRETGRQYQSLLEHLPHKT